MDEHDIRLTSITRDLIWPRTRFFQGMREIDVGRGTENGVAKFCSRFWVNYEIPQGGLCPPPIRARVNLITCVNAIGSTRGHLRSCWPLVTSGHTHELRYYRVSGKSWHFFVCCQTRTLIDGRSANHHRPAPSLTGSTWIMQTWLCNRVHSWINERRGILSLTACARRPGSVRTRRKLHNHVAFFGERSSV